MPLICNESFSSILIELYAISMEIIALCFFHNFSFFLSFDLRIVDTTWNKNFSP